ncbi:MAG TPA: sulfatase-like hydrolase/transferase [Blastocatellia bacterium]|nr:sulfatase-like hydrolase/transferase [Blastocatellia bacterium]
MSRIPSGTATGEELDPKLAEPNWSRDSRERAPLLKSLCSYALAGLAAASLLGLIEWIDLNIQLTPIFASFNERLTLTAYFSLNLLIGSVVGLSCGLFAYAAESLTTRLGLALARGRDLKLLHRLIAVLAISALAGFLLYLQPGIFGFTIGAIREAEKIALAHLLLKAEHLFAYLVVTAMVISCTVIWYIARASASLHSLIRLAWMLLLAVVILTCYYVDSRVEVQQYEFSLHRAMFLLEFTLAMGLVASLYFSFAHKLQRGGAVHAPVKRSTVFSVIALLLFAVTFTFIHFDKNQNLKTQVFFRSTQTKQFFRLAQWALDFDRDGYSAVLGGGDADDRRADINPGQSEIIGDGTDNNCIGGDLTQSDVSDWMNGLSELNHASNPAAKRFNVIFVFVDTVRADHLSLYGYERNTSPSLNRLGERACVFDNAFAPSPSTYQAVPKFMQSSYWDAHLQSWTEVLAHNGYDTVLFPGRRASTLYRRIKDPQMISSARTGNLKDTVEAVINRFSNTPPNQPFCAYVYTFEPHMPYRLRRDFYFGPSNTDRYDGEIAYVDQHLGKLFEWLESSGRINDTIVAIMSDHGESLGERGVYKHNSQLYNEQMHVPMIVYVPNLAPRRVTDYVSTIDLGSTILNAVGIACPKEYVGTSLLPLMRGDPFTRPPVYGEHWQRNDSPFLSPEHDVDPEIRKFMVISQDGYKLIYNRNSYTFELFNLGRDPKEQYNLYDLMLDKAEEMKRLLGRFVDVSSVLRPWDADEQRFFRGQSDDEDKE